MRHRDEEPGPGQKNVSIHAPARGATSGEIKQGALIRVSIHAPARGATSAY
ncbi:Octaprenyl diphosphate synthase / Dimethylallyltransferase / (2E,6E)-farnesyl diphosphate synthase / Geranylgeranyl pyrophosphate synthetase [Olavius algarvensis spirochete endosymbiont]|nr:Octaprenyl diphosphate synthase / Dimethylallyltransferase / (2E,6E)-farnesyl diphosphate synthase / Geranylgeranyl pyrophosphate synthetase [Olavius algarvensis spirochete endosymbiont]